jgi:hypothetical protein
VVVSDTTHAERYLRWRASQPRCEAETAQRGYHTALRGQGADAAELDAARTSLTLLSSHLITHRPGWTRTPVEVRPIQLSPSNRHSQALYRPPRVGERALMTALAAPEPGSGLPATHVGPDVAVLDEHVTKLEASPSEPTPTNSSPGPPHPHFYASDWAHFVGWCELVGRQLQPVPADPDPDPESRTAVLPPRCGTVH